MNLGKNHVCPVGIAGGLDNRIRRWLQDPRKILAPYIEESMTVLDLGCGPGFFSIDMAGMVGKSGRVIAADLQEGMLDKLRDKIRGAELEDRIILHKCEKDRIGVSKKVDFALAFYMVHEVPDKQLFFDELISIMNPNGRLFIVEPIFHVSKKSFEDTVKKAQTAGFVPVERPKLFFSQTVMMQAA
ncbi:MAG: class I SAM-dependent methyltransferase [Syntrophobacteraceae bacterium]